VETTARGVRTCDEWSAHYATGGGYARVGGESPVDVGQARRDRVSKGIGRHPGVVVVVVVVAVAVVAVVVWLRLWLRLRLRV